MTLTLLRLNNLWNLCDLGKHLSSRIRNIFATFFSHSYCRVG